MGRWSNSSELARYHSKWTQHSTRHYPDARNGTDLGAIPGPPARPGKLNDDNKLNRETGEGAAASRQALLRAGKICRAA
jgi:hypothetical protein